MELEEIRKKILPVLQRAEVKSAAIFGSISRGQETQESDIEEFLGGEFEKVLFSPP